MKKINYTKATPIALLCFASILLIVALVLFVQSFNVYDDGFGTSFSVDEDYLVLFIVSSIVFIYGLLNFLNKGNKESLATTKYLCISVASGLVSLYSFGKFFKQLAKLGSEFVFQNYQIYLYFGLIGIALALYAILRFLEIKENN